MARGGVATESPSESRTAVRRATWCAAALFHAAYLIVAAVHLASKLDRRPDFQMIELPILFKLRMALVGGSVHYWDPSILNGVPLFATGFYPILNPYNLLLFVVEPGNVFVLLPSLLRALGATGMFYCLRARLRLDASAALFGGMLYSLLPVVDYHVPLDYWGMLVAPALLPWLHAVALRGVERRCL